MLGKMTLTELSMASPKGVDEGVLVGVTVTEELGEIDGEELGVTLGVTDADEDGDGDSEKLIPTFSEISSVVLDKSNPEISSTSLTVSTPLFQLDFNASCTLSGIGRSSRLVPSCLTELFFNLDSCALT